MSGRSQSQGRRGREGKVVKSRSSERPYSRGSGHDRRGLHPGATGGGPDARDLAGRIADAWLAFARTGNPNHKGLPQWPEFTAAQCPTMVFDTTCTLVNAPDVDHRRLLTL